MSKLDLAACLAVFDAAAEYDRKQREARIPLVQEACAAVLTRIPEKAATAIHYEESRVSIQIPPDILKRLAKTRSGWRAALQEALRDATGVVWTVDAHCVVDLATLEAAIRRMAREATAQEEAP